MREGRNFIETWSGNTLFLPDADLDAICIEDIAHSLSNVCRFAGHVDQFYSVAEHSINVAWIVPREHQLQALLHDATEAYICDIPTPFKRMLPEYAVLEDNLWGTIAKRFGVPVELSFEVKEADRIMLMTERDALKKNRTRPWSPEYENTPRWPGFSSRPTLHAGGDMAKMFLDHFTFYGGTP
jgi:hypothetical protein